MSSHGIHHELSQSQLNDQDENVLGSSSEQVGHSIQTGSFKMQKPGKDPKYSSKSRGASKQETFEQVPP